MNIERQHEATRRLYHTPAQSSYKGTKDYENVISKLKQELNKKNHIIKELTQKSESSPSNKPPESTQTSNNYGSTLSR